MISRRLQRLVVRWFFTLAVPLLLVMAGVRLLLSYEFLRFQYQRPGFPADIFGLTTADRLEYGMFAITFLFSADGDDELSRVRLPREKCWQPSASAADCPLFNQTELGHLRDVRRILQAGFALAILCLFVAIFCLFAVIFCQIAAISRSEFSSEVRRGLQRGANLTLAIIFTLAVISLAAWDRAFDAFHEVFFAEGTWRFPFSDSLIRLYPEQLFVDAAVAIGCFTAICSLVILVLVWVGERRRP